MGKLAGLELAGAGLADSRGLAGFAASRSLDVSLAWFAASRSLAAGLAGFAAAGLAGFGVSSSPAGDATLAGAAGVGRPVIRDRRRFVRWNLPAGMFVPSDAFVPIPT
jgi:hypothetical protein